MSATAAEILNKIAQQEMLDERVLLEITEAAGIAPMELLELFREDSAETITRLQTAFAEADFIAVHREAHTLKSSAAHVGAVRVAGLAKVLENATREDMPELAGQLLERLVATVADFYELIANYSATRR